MAIFKRGDIWHTDFFLDGERFRMSLETTDKRRAKSKEKEHIGLRCDFGVSGPREVTGSPRRSSFRFPRLRKRQYRPHEAAEEPAHFVAQDNEGR